MWIFFHAVGGGTDSDSLGHGVVELKFLLLRSCSVSTALGAGLSDGPDAKPADLLIYAQKSLDLVPPGVVERPVSPGHG